MNREKQKGGRRRWGWQGGFIPGFGVAAVVGAIGIAIVTSVVKRRSE